MILIRGKGVSAGTAAGSLHFYQNKRNENPETEPREPGTEWERFQKARAAAMKKLDDLAEKAFQEAGREASEVFEAHKLLLSDRAFEIAVEGFIRENGMNAEAAVSRASSQMAERLEALEDEVIRVRALDVKDVSEGILDALKRETLTDNDPSEGNEAAMKNEAPAVMDEVLSGAASESSPVIIAAEDLTPSELIKLGKKQVAGIILRNGSSLSHTAILARALGIPAVCGTGDQIKPEQEGCEALVNGSTGEVMIKETGEDFPPAGEVFPLAGPGNPSDQKPGDERSIPENLHFKMPEENCRDIKVFCNAGLPEEITAVLESGADGIGLFRTEFLFMGCEEYPSEEAQLEAYKKVLQAMDGREVVFRTLDIGGDKKASFLKLPEEENPALGIRGIRACLMYPELFRIQLRALYRASAFGKMGILFPMITSEWEVQEALRMCRQVKRELEDEGRPYDRDVKTGIMIETPAAALLSDRLSEIVDFFSCGTNDLTQFTLAGDRRNAALEHFYDPRHPAVLRLLKMVCDNAHKNGLRVSICGELGADPEMTETLLSLGIDDFSVPPAAVPLLRRRLEVQGKQ